MICDGREVDAADFRAVCDSVYLVDESSFEKWLRDLDVEITSPAADEIETIAGQGSSLTD